MGLWISGSCLPDQDVQRGVQVALDTLKEMGVSIDEAYDAHYGQGHGSEYNHQAESAWERAELAAFRALFADMPNWPQTARLVLNQEPGESVPIRQADPRVDPHPSRMQHGLPEAPLPGLEHRLWVFGSGLDEADVEKGATAALGVLAEAGVSAEEAYAAHVARRHNKDYDHAAEAAWERAELAAFRVMFADLPRWPETARLVYGE